MDRVRAVRLAVKCIQHLETYADKSADQIAADDLSMAVIGIKGAKVVLGAMKELELNETDWKARRPKNESWLELNHTINTLSGRPEPEDCCETCGKGK